ncbi:hypothetical protein B1C78_13320 [Thioalkalivibrio denitrificans]|uniref:Uncharacterized protein n=1 Tax=Thioalkalivibrio denitrificans TaxID=108003 RepID=A0A1V3NCY0_9GAMM|nr:tetratricopeptide repeat-containing sulfotransferase family protein [Thioalkalivibrio denitrificans]OOG22901.1 hypothetical protein B1C78_13320 [Thioalkalivibrio denitrificans]
MTDDLLQQARAHHAAGELSVAESLYRSILATAPDHAEANLGLGEIGLASGQPAQAVGYLQKALNAAPENPQRWLALARALTLAGYPDDAGTVLDEGRKAGVLQDARADQPLPRSAREALDKALKDHARGRTARALKEAERVVGQFPDNGEARKRAGGMQLAAGQFGQALEHLRHAARLLPDDTEVLSNLGGALQKLGYLTQARGCLERAIELDERNAAAHSNLAALLNRLDEHEAARHHAERSLELKPDSPQSLVNLGNALKALSQREKARKCFEKALALDPKSVPALTNLGTLAKEDGDPTEATRWYEQALDLQPSHAETLHNLGTIYKDLGQPNSARQYYERAWAAAPQRLEHAEALTEFKTFTDPEDPLLASLATALQSGRLSRGEKVFAGFGLGKALLDLGRYDDAFACYEMGNKAAYTQPDQSGRYLSGLLHTYRSVCDKDFFRRTEGYGLRETNDIFLLGMSRSGKSLVEGLIACHPGTQPLGEDGAFVDFVKERLRGLEGQIIQTYLKDLDIEHSREDALAWLNQRQGEYRYRTWTLPGNLFYLALLALWLPRTPVVFCRRDLMDLALSCYFKRYAKGHEYTYDLEALGRQIRIYDEFIKLWLEVLPNPMLEVRYEDLVREPEATARRIYDFLGLDFQPGHLAALDQNRELVEHLGPANSLEAPAPLRADFIGFSKPFHDKLEPMMRAYRELEIG